MRSYVSVSWFESGYIQSAPDLLSIFTALTAFKRVIAWLRSLLWLTKLKSEIRQSQSGFESNFSFKLFFGVCLSADTIVFMKFHQELCINHI